MVDKRKVDTCFASLRRLHIVADKLCSNGRLGVLALRSEELTKAAASLANSWRTCYYDHVPDIATIREDHEGRLVQLRHFVRYVAL